MWVSLTSVGPRKDHLKRAVAALLEQRAVALAGVLLTLPTVSHRPAMPPYTDADCAELAALSPLVRVHRPAEDLGPAMKYCGAEAALEGYRGPVFVGDDDQRYHPDLLQRLRHRLDDHHGHEPRPPVLQNRLEATRSCTKGGLVRGFAGLLVQAPFHLRGITDFVRRAPAGCRVVDDDLYSLFLWLRGVPVERGVGNLGRIFADGAPGDDVATALHSTTPRAAATAAVFAWGGWPPEAVQSPPVEPRQHWLSAFHLGLAFAGRPVVVRGAGVPGAARALDRALQATDRPVLAPGCSAVVLLHRADDYSEQVRAHGTARPPRAPVMLVRWPAHPRTVRAAARRAGLGRAAPDFPEGDSGAPVQPIVMRFPRSRPLPPQACTVEAAGPPERARTVLPSGRTVGLHGRGGIAVWGQAGGPTPQRVVQTGAVGLRDVHAVELPDRRVLVLLVGTPAGPGRRPHVLLCDVAARRTVPLVLRDQARHRRPRRQPTIPATGVRLFLHEGAPHCVVAYAPLCLLRVVDPARGACSVLCGSVGGHRAVLGGTPPIAWAYPRVAAVAVRGGESVPVLLDCRAGKATFPGAALPGGWGAPTQLVTHPPDGDFELRCADRAVRLRYEAVCALFSD